jgi:hypothetical protein
MMNWKGFEMELSWLILRYYSGIRVERPSKTTDSLNQDSRSPGRNLNPRCSQQEAGVLTTRPQLSVGVSVKIGISPQGKNIDCGYLWTEPWDSSLIHRTEGWRNLRSEELNNLYSLPNMMLKPRQLVWTQLVHCLGYLLKTHSSSDGGYFRRLDWTE